MKTKGKRILVVEDDASIQRALRRSLTISGYEVLVVDNGRQAVELVREQQPDLVLLDLSLPGEIDGLGVCIQVRQWSQIPIIIVSARTDEQQKVQALDLGADDYLTKPFNIDELAARVRAVLRRTQFIPQEQAHATRTVTTIGNITIDYSQRLVTVDDKEIVLTPTEYRVLAYLIQNAGRVVTQDLLLEHVWGPEYVGESHMLQVNVNRLRRKIEPEPAHPRYILTEPWVGYRFIPNE